MSANTNNSLAHKAGAIARNPRALTPLVLFMGFLGASLRYVLELVIPAGGGFPYATLIVNIFGCFTLEIINLYVSRRMNLPAPVVKSLSVGFVGAFTTLSAFSTENLEFLASGRYDMFACYFLMTIATTLAAAFAGYFTVRRIEKSHSTKGGGAR